jgi:glyoxylase-like metal-dependent hydrolase (beta-lactamase superfamily II)
MKLIGDEVYYLGEFGKPDTLSIYMIIHEDNKRGIIVDSAPSNFVKEIIDICKVSKIEISEVLLTHIHPDHAGGIWLITKYYPNAKVYVSSRGARHIIDPSKLVPSAKEALGEIYYIWGDIKPVKEKNVVNLDVKDYEVIELGERKIKVIATIGHAPHHLSYLDLKSRILFTGDALGTYYKDCNVIIPASAMPSYRHELAIEDIERLKKEGPKCLAIPHFSYHYSVNKLIDKNLYYYENWAKLITEEACKGATANSILNRFANEFKEYECICKDKIRRQIMLSKIKGFLTYLKRSNKL